MKMMNKSNLDLIFGLFYLVISGILILMVSSFEIAKELIEVFLVFIGMFSMTSITTIHRYSDSKSSPTIRISFDNSKSQMVLDDLLTLKKNRETKQGFIDVEPLPWEPNTNDLVISDPSLALAKLRIDIEKEIRRLFFQDKNFSEFKFFTLKQMLEKLLDSKWVEPKIVDAVNEVLPTLNKVVHGAKVSKEIAISVLEVGEPILKHLQSKSSILEKDFKTIETEHPDISVSWTNLGTVWKNKGEYDKAIEYYEKALAINLKTYDVDHPNVATCWNNLGESLRAIGEYDKAIEYFEKSLTNGLKILGAEHPIVGTSWNNLASVWKLKGKNDKAMENFEKAMTVFENAGLQHRVKLTKESMADLKKNDGAN